MEAALRNFVRNRAHDRCEYCGLVSGQEPLPLHIEHIIARQHEGGDDASNLALACHHCNLHKGTNLTARDPETGRVVRLFNPRVDQWVVHFRSRAGRVYGRTPKGRATVRLLRMNQDGRAELRGSG